MDEHFQTAVGHDNDSSPHEERAGKDHQPACRERVQHDYHDYASLDDDAIPSSTNAGPSSDNNAVDSPFPVRLHYMLQDMEKDGMAHVVSWMPHGRSFLVHEKKTFVKEVLGSWFRMSKLPSFQRQLNLYGFKRLTSGPDKGAYYHELFLRQRPYLARRIQRFKVKNQGMRRAASPETEPNLYSYPFLPPNPTPLSVGVDKNMQSPENSRRVLSGDSLLLNGSAGTGGTGVSLKSFLPVALGMQQQQQSQNPRGMQQPLQTSERFMPIAVHHMYDPSSIVGSPRVPTPVFGVAGAACTTSGGQLYQSSPQDLAMALRYGDIGPRRRDSALVSLLFKNVDHQPVGGILRGSSLAANDQEQVSRSRWAFM